MPYKHDTPGHISVVSRTPADTLSVSSRLVAGHTTSTTRPAIQQDCLDARDHRCEAPPVILDVLYSASSARFMSTTLTRGSPNRPTQRPVMSSSTTWRTASWLRPP